MSRRPTTEQLAHYEAKLNAANHSESMRGISLAGDFLADCMEAEGFGDEEIENAIMWKKIEEALAEKKRRETYGTTPVEQSVPEPTDLFIAYIGQVRGFCGEAGIFPQPLLYKDPEGKITMVAVAADGAECVRQAKEALRGGAEEIVFGLDRSAAPGQGLEFNDFVTVVWFVGGEFYTAVINYVPAEDEADQIIRDPDWNNNWWNNQMRDNLLPELRAFVGHQD